VANFARTSVWHGGAFPLNRVMEGWSKKTVQKSGKGGLLAKAAAIAGGQNGGSVWRGQGNKESQKKKGGEGLAPPRGEGVCVESFLTVLKSNRVFSNTERDG